MIRMRPSAWAGFPIIPTVDGGLARYMINDTGAASVAGIVVHASGTVTNGVKKIVVDKPDPIGVILTSGVPDGELVPVVFTGAAKVLFIGSTTLGHLARGFLTADGAGYIAGFVLSEAVPSSPFSSDKHFYEIGHVLEARTGAGLALVMLHFN